MNTRSKTKNLIRTSHRQSSEIHRALSSKDKKTLVRLLENGERPCVGEGINCFYLAKTFCPYDCVHLLLQYEPKGVKFRNVHGVTLLMHYAQNANELTDLLNFGANPNEKSNNGLTPLMYSVKNQTKCKKVLPSIAIIQALDVLIKAGANVNDTCNMGQTVLIHSAQNFDYFCTETLKLLLESGADPLKQDESGLTVLSHAMKNFIDSFQIIQNKLVIFEALAYLSTLPQYENFVFNCEPKLHPQSLILSKLLLINNFTSIDDISYDIFSILLNAKFLNPNLIVMCNLNCSNHLYNLPFGPISLFFNISMCQPPNCYKNSIKTSLKKLLCCGYTFSTTTVSISPLTVVLFNELISNSYCKESLESLVKFLIKYGADVEQRIMRFNDNNFLQDISEGLLIPDVIRAAITRGLTNVLGLLIPHFAHPPLSLLCYVNPNIISMEEVKNLAAWGPLHSSTLHKNIIAYINCMNFSQEVKQIFKELHNSPPTLKELCRTSIRTLVAPHACEPGNSLPRLLLIISPPGLRDYLLMREC